MRTLAVIGTLAVLLVGGAVTVAAAPGTSDLGAAPSGSTAPATHAPSTSSAAPSTTASGGPWQANLQPLDVISGSAKLTENADGTGTLMLRTSGLGGTSPWHVYLDRGHTASVSTAANHEFAFRSGRDFTMFTSEVLSIPLTKAQMDRLNADLSSAGVVTATVTDGIRHSVAYLS